MPDKCTLQSFLVTNGKSYRVLSKLDSFYPILSMVIQNPSGRNLLGTVPSYSNSAAVSTGLRDSFLFIFNTAAVKSWIHLLSVSP
ncbi:hypothetical protein VNO80_19122 [Phaseolus coccineus]|uniref:Uncharacterized protein n=1 Tax=Phaseolus coccineus TaxID=3886 RepID=A0AAN9MFJ8_PHACN